MNVCGNVTYAAKASIRMEKHSLNVVRFPFLLNVAIIFVPQFVVYISDGALKGVQKGLEILTPTYLSYDQRPRCSAAVCHGEQETHRTLQAPKELKAQWITGIFGSTVPQK